MDFTQLEAASDGRENVLVITHVLNQIYSRSANKRSVGQHRSQNPWYMTGFLCILLDLVLSQTPFELRSFLPYNALFILN